MANFFREHLEFFRQFCRRFESTGAIAPSSRFLAQAMTRPLRRRGRPARILEVGPGTGAVTRGIIRAMGPNDRLDLVEINDEFANMLRRRLAMDPLFQPVADRTRVVVCPLQDFDANCRYDFIISGLPLNNFDAETVREIFDIFFRLLLPGGVLSYFEYMYVRQMRKLFTGPRDRTRLNSIDSIMNAYLVDHRIGREWVFLNLPPAWVQHLQSVPDAAKAATRTAPAWNTV